MSARWSFTACLRWPDVDTTAGLPPDWSWDGTCTSIVNSDGVAADPARELVTRGGALLTPRARSPQHLADIAGDLWDRLRPGSNYRTHLTVTARAPGIGKDLAGCRRIVAFTRMHLPNLWPALDPLDGLMRGVEGESALAYAHAYLDSDVRRLRRELVGEHRHRRRLAATTLHGFISAGLPGPGEAAECAALDWDGSLSLSCFAGPRSADQLHAAARFAQLWVESALDGGDPLAALLAVSPGLPRQQAFDLALEEGWRATNLRFNARSVVAARLRQVGAAPRAPVRRPSRFGARHP